VEVVVFENNVSSNQKLHSDRIMKVLVHRTKCIEEVWNYKKNKMPYLRTIKKNAIFRNYKKNKVPYFPVYKNIPHSQSSVFRKAPIRNVFNLVYDGGVSPDFSGNEVGEKSLVL
jgi:hypothetical protein